MHKNSVIIPENCDVTNEAGRLPIPSKNQPPAEALSMPESDNPALFQEVLSQLESGKPFGVRYEDGTDHVIEEIIKDGEF